MSRLVVTGATAVLAVGIAGSRVQGLATVINPPLQAAGLEANDTHASASLLGQFRTSTATWLYLHADLYLHNGVEMRPLTSSERRNGTQGSAAGTNDLGEGEGAGEVTVIPSSERDFRGPIGDIERACGAYKDMNGHLHNPPETAMPLFRLMTAIDPQFLPGWTMGSMILAREVNTGPDSAIAFLKRGYRENPGEFTIPFEIGFQLASYKKEPRQALVYLDDARRLAQKRVGLDEDQKESLRQTYRLLGICLRDIHEPADELGIAKEGLALFPDDPLLLRLARTVSPGA